MKRQKTWIEIKVDKGETYHKRYVNPVRAQAWVMRICNRVWEQRGNMWGIQVTVNGKSVRHDWVLVEMTK